MGDIFDKLLSGSGGGDIFDRLTVASKASQNLGRIRAETPEERTFMGGLRDSVIPSREGLQEMARLTMSEGPIEQAKAAWRMGKGLVGAQWDQAMQAKDEYLQGNIREGLGHSVAAAVPIVGPAAKNAIEDIESGDIGYGLGQLTGIVGAAAIPGGKRASNAKKVASAPKRIARAEADYASLFGKSAKSRAIADHVTPEMMDRGIGAKMKDSPFANPRRDLAEMAEERASAIDTDTPVRNMKNTVTTEPIVADIKIARDELFNEVAAIPMTSNKRNLLASLRQRFPDARLVIEDDVVRVQEIRHPDMRPKVSRLNKAEQHIRNSSQMEANEIIPFGIDDTDDVVRNIKKEYPDAEVAIEPGWGWDRGDYGSAVIKFTKAPRKGQVGTLSNDTVLNLRKDYDYFSNPEERLFQDTESVRLPADAQVANSLRNQVNLDPVAKAANEKKSFWLNVKTIAKLAPEGKGIAAIIGDNAKLAAAAAAAGGLTGMAIPSVGAMGAGGGAMWAVIRTIRDIPRTPAWRAASAIRRRNFGKALQAGDYGKAAEIGAEIVGGSIIADGE